METKEQESEKDETQWAIVELMGHIRYGGIVSKDTKFGTEMLRIDVPQKDDSFVTQLINPDSLYRLTLCSEEIGRAAASQGQSKPMSQWEVSHLLPGGESEENHDEEVW